MSEAFVTAPTMKDSLRSAMTRMSARVEASRDWVGVGAVEVGTFGMVVVVVLVVAVAVGSTLNGVLDTGRAEGAEELLGVIASEVAETDVALGE